MLYSGIDLHKRTAVIATVDETGKVVCEASLPTSRFAVARYFAELPDSTRATVEATSSWYWLRDLLHQEGVPLTLAHAKFVKAIAYAKVKTDAVDALTLAQLHRVDLIPRAHMVSPELRPLRDLLRTRLQLVEKRVSAKNSVHRLLEKFNVPDPASLPDEAALSASLYEEQIELLDSQIRRIEQQLQPRLIPEPDIQRLLWIPGIGKITAFTLYLQNRRNRSLPLRPPVLLLLPRRARCPQLRRQEPSRPAQGRESVPQARPQSRRGQGHSILPRDQALLSAQGSAEEPCHRADARPEGTRA